MTYREKLIAFGPIWKAYILPIISYIVPSNNLIVNKL